MDVLDWTIAIVVSYGVGSTPFGVLIAKAKGINIREHGSKNIGATNVGRILGKQFGFTCFVLDVCKGAIPVLIVGNIAGTLGTPINEISTNAMLLWICVALAALFGHMYSPWLKFGGGKGVATTFGGMAAMWPLLTIPILLALLAWIVTVQCSKMISLASLVASLVMFVDAFVLVVMNSTVEHAWPILVVTGLITLMVFWKHRSNIGRMIRNEEPRMGSTS